MPLPIYQINFTNIEDSPVNVQLQDLSGSGDVENIELTGSEFPATLDTPGVDSDKTAPIRGKRLRVGFVSTDDYDVETFSDGEEGRFLTRITLSTFAIPFLGGLILDDNQEAFQPKPNPVLLSAGDGLGTLKESELRNTSGEIPVGHYKIMSYIIWSLQDLIDAQQLRVAMNLYEGVQDPTTTHAFDYIYLDADTFRIDSTKMMDRWTVLEMILEGFGCFLCYDQDRFWIIRWDEYDNASGDVTTLRCAAYTETGVFTGYETVDVDKTIVDQSSASYEGYQLSQDSAIRKFQRRVNYVKLINEFEYPVVPCNADFSEGALLLDVSETEKHFEIDCWTYGKYNTQNPNPDTIPTPDSDAYIRRNYEDGYEKERYVVLPFDTDPHALISSGIEVHENDRIGVSVDMRWATDNSGGQITVDVFSVLLQGDDNTNWVLQSDGSWLQSDVNWATNYDTVQWIFIPDDTDETEFTNFSIESKNIPVTGRVYICLYNNGDLGTSVDDVDTYYNNLSVVYGPFINGSFDTYTAQYHKVSSGGDERKTLEKNIRIFDSPKKLIKGTVKKLDGGLYVLTETWNDYVNAASLSNERLGKFLVYQYWNQYRKTRSVIESDFQGLNSSEADGIPGLIHRYRVLHGGQDAKYFMLTSIRDMDFWTCGWKGVLVEMSDADGDRLYTDEHEFKYIND